MGPDKLGDNSAAVDVANEDDRRRGLNRKAHIGNVAGPKIDFCRTASHFNDDNVGLGFQCFKATGDRVQKLCLS